MSPPATLPDLLADAADPDAEALVAGAERRTSAELDADARAAAAALAGLGIGRGDVVGLLAPNVAAWPAVALGATALGARVDAFHTWVRARDLDHLLAASGAAVLVLAREVRGHDLLAEVATVVPEIAEQAPGTWRTARFPNLREVVVLGGEPGHAGVRAFDALDPVDPGPNAARGEDPAFVMYTSGSTSAPKAVLLCHRDLILNGFHIGERMGLGAADRVWLGSPLFWSYGGANALMATLTHGATLVLQERFAAADTAALMVDERVTAAYLLPAITDTLASDGSASERIRAAGTLRTGLTIGRPEEIRRVVDALGATEICNIYGQTETYGNCCVTPHDWPLSDRLVSQGPPLPGVEVRVVDDSPDGDGSVLGVLGDDEYGELQVRGRVTPGYLGLPSGAGFTDDRWFRTGDRLRVRSADGAVEFGARLTEMIKTSGINVAPAQVESALAEHPSVSEVSVVGAPHPHRDEVVIAFVTVSSAIDGGALRDWCAERMAGFTVPWEIVVLDALPRTDTGKPHRAGLAQRAAALVAERV